MIAMELNKFQKMIIHTLTSYFGPAGSIVYHQTCDQIKIDSNQLGKTHIPLFVQSIQAQAESMLDIHKSKQMLGVLLRFETSKFG